MEKLIDPLVLKYILTLWNPTVILSHTLHSATCLYPEPHKISPHPPASFKVHLTLSFHLCFDLPSGLFPGPSSAETMDEFFRHVPHPPTHIILLDFFT